MSNTVAEAVAVAGIYPPESLLSEKLSLKSARFSIFFGRYSVMETVTELMVTSRVWAVERSKFLIRGIGRLCDRLLEPRLCSFCDPEPPGKLVTAACCATTVELSRGLRVEVPLM